LWRPDFCERWLRQFAPSYASIPTTSVRIKESGSRKTRGLAIERKIVIMVTRLFIQNQKDSGAPGLLGLAARASEAAQDGLAKARSEAWARRSSLVRRSLQHAPESLDAAFGLRALCRDEGDVELLQSGAELRGLALAGELVVNGPSAGRCE
jgi:hypothetical protein